MIEALFITWLLALGEIYAPMPLFEHAQTPNDCWGVLNGKYIWMPCSPSTATAPDLDVLRARVDALEKRVKELEGCDCLARGNGQVHMNEGGMFVPPGTPKLIPIPEAQPPATACDRATALTIRIVRDNTALLTGGRAMGESERAKVEKELKEASKACKERGDGK